LREAVRQSHGRQGERSIPFLDGKMAGSNMGKSEVLSAQQVSLDNPKANLQIVLQTTVTDGTPGVARVLAVDSQ
jgi:hypothetical protein